MTLPQRELAKERAQVWSRLTSIYYDLGNMDDYVVSAFQNVLSADLLGQSSQLCDATTQLIPVLTSLGHPELAEAFCHASLTMAEQLSDQSTLANSFLKRAVFMAGKGQLAAALDMAHFSATLFKLG